MKHFYLIAILVITSNVIFSQESDTTRIVQNAENETSNSGLEESKIYYGGYMNLSFGGTKMIGIKPLVGYKLTPKLSSGFQLSLEYYEIYSTNTNNYGASIFGRYRLIPKMYLHSEFSMMNYDQAYVYGKNDRNWVPLLFLGGGYSHPVSKRTWLTAQLLFDVINHEYSPYKDWEPFFSVGVGIGF